MGPYAELLLLAIAAAFYPVLLAVDLIAFRASHPGRLLGSFLLGGLLTTLSVGLAAIYALQDSPLLSGSDKKETDHTVGITIGVLALAASFVLARGYHVPLRRKKPKSKAKGPSRTERMLDRGAPLAFVAGIVLSIVPGVFPLVALKNIAELDLPIAGNVAAVLGFNLIMFSLIEVPLAGFLVGPDRTAELTVRFSAWLGRNARRVCAAVLAVVGAYLLIRGIAATLIFG